MLSIYIQDKELRSLGIHLRMLSSITQDKQFLAATGIELAAQGKKNLDESSADGITSYKLLAPSTIKNKKYTHPNRNAYKPLIATADMLQSIDSEVSDTLYLTAKSYAKYHQFGTSKMEARPIFSIRDNNYKNIVDFIKTFAKNTFKK